MTVIFTSTVQRLQEKHVEKGFWKR